MKSILTGTFATLVLGAAIASSQTPPAQQAPAPAGGQAQPAVQEPAGQRNAPAKAQASTYKGILKGSAASGWTISPITARSAAANTPGATATAGGADQVTYIVVAAEGAKVDLASMADDCVEISGVLSPEMARATPGASDPAAAAAAAGATAKNRTLTVVTIKEAEGCK
jgi:hypothetical protein